MNKKGWLRIVEAFIAVLIIASVLLVIISRSAKPVEEEIHEIQRSILKQIENNETLRADILQNEKQKTTEFISRLIPVQLDFAIKICEIDDICRMEEYVEKDVYADEILISATLQEYAPKKLKMFVWKK